MAIHTDLSDTRARALTRAYAAHLLRRRDAAVAVAVWPNDAAGSADRYVFVGNVYTIVLCAGAIHLCFFVVVCVCCLWVGLVRNPGPERLICTIHGEYQVYWEILAVHA